MSAPIHITSLDDPRIADYRNVRDADLRGGGGLSPLGPAGTPNKLFMAESEPVIRRLIESRRYAIKSLFVSDEKWESLRAGRPHSPDSMPCFAASGTPVYVGTLDLLRAVAGYRHHGGALAAGIRPSPAELDPARLLAPLENEQRFCTLLVEGVTHVDNIGGIFRNAAVFGAAGVILDSTCADPLFRKAIRVSMGHVFNVPWGIAPSLSETIVVLRERCGASIIAAESCERAVTIDRFPFPPRCAIVVGAERQGISSATLSLADYIIEIPMARADTPLNVAVASAVVLHEWRRSVTSIQAR